MTGKNGSDLVLYVPPGTIIKDGRSGRVIADLVKKGQLKIVAKGGRGGLGNTRFKSSTHQTPREFKPGAKGEKKEITLELAMIADVGLVGLPNSGKSTLLAVVSNAKPKVAPYPFTTLEPVLGKIRYKSKSFIIADIPGLIEGASSGKGLGHKFLRHIGRTKLIIHLLSADSSDFQKDYITVRTELKNFQQGLENKKELVVISKCDLGFKKSKNFKYDLEISAQTNKNISQLLDLIVQNL